MSSTRGSTASHESLHEMSEIEQNVVNVQTRAAETRRKMTERYHKAVVRGRHPRSFPRNSALWVHANQSKERSVRLQRGQSLASVVGGNPSVFSSLSFQGSSYSAAPGDEDPSYHPQHSAWSSQQGSLDLGAPPGTAGMGMFPPVFSAPPGTEESKNQYFDSAELQEKKINDDQRVSNFQLGRRMSIHRKKATKANVKIHEKMGTSGSRVGGGTKAAAEASAKARHRKSSRQSNLSISPSEAVAHVRRQHSSASSIQSSYNGRQNLSTASTSSSLGRPRSKKAHAIGLGANLSGISMSTGQTNDDNAISPYEEDTVSCWKKENINILHIINCFYYFISFSDNRFQNLQTRLKFLSFTAQQLHYRCQMEGKIVAFNGLEILINYDFVCILSISCLNIY